MRCSCARGLGFILSGLFTTVGFGQTATLSLQPDAATYNIGDPVVVSVSLDAAAGVDEVIGGQFRLAYDPNQLTFVSVAPAAATWTTLISSDTATAGRIDLSVGVPADPPGAGALSGVMAVVTFTAAGEICNTPGAVSFVADDPPLQTRLSGVLAGSPVAIQNADLTRNDLTAIQVDESAPVISGTVTDTGAGSFDPNCVATLSVDLAIADCCVDPNTLDVTVDVIGGVADPNGLTITTSSITGDVVISRDPNACSVDVTFTAAASDCDGRPGTRVETFTIADLTAPTLGACPADIAVLADAGGCTADVSWAPVTVADACDPNVVVVYGIDLDDDGNEDAATSDPNFVFPVGSHRVEARVTDACGNSPTPCSFVVTVTGEHEFEVILELDGALAGTTIERCIDLVLSDCVAADLELQQDVTFIDGVATILTTVPCGAVGCATADDSLHTLRRRVEVGDGLTLSGSRITADFTGARRLLQGDLFGELPAASRDVIDILDFGVYVTTWGQSFPGATCATSFPHTDLDGSGQIDVDEFSFIQANFFEIGDFACCGGGGSGALATMSDPVGYASITLPELTALGLPQLHRADLNSDGVLDMGDIAAFLNGERPKPERSRARPQSISAIEGGLDAVAETATPTVKPSR